MEQEAPELLLHRFQHFLLRMKSQSLGSVSNSCISNLVRLRSFEPGSDCAPTH